MASVHIRKGLDVPITGQPAQKVEDARPVVHVAMSAVDFVGHKAKMLVKEGDDVVRGQPLVEERKNPGVLHVAPATGVVVHVHRGAKRALQSVVIALSDAERAGDDAAVPHQTFQSYTGQAPAGLSRDQVVALMVEGGAWPALRQRPFDRIPPIDGTPTALFINTMDTRPNAADPQVVLAGRMDDFHAGVAALSKLCDTVHLVRAKGSSIDAGGAKGVQLSEFSGKHPAGLVGTHIHFLSPADREHPAWHVDYADVIAIGHLFRTGRIDVHRVVALSGPAVKNPRLLRTRVGAHLATLTEGELVDGELRVISGDVLSGRKAMDEQTGWLGPYHRQISVLREQREREFIGWLMPGLDKFSTIPAYLGGILPGKKFAFGTSTHGEQRPIVPLGMYERVMPLDLVPTYLLRSLQTGDVERSEKLGCLELSEEDLALCAFVCPGKLDHQGALRTMLDQIWKEG
ncbi:MAG: Na(+)-translocating NADH-quinone reductase subunit A [Alphaproteobacteria bacterium]|nr:Na(+)-translocating NADH-quinone reductase subunit A [Alphaproteobacteria bacterium]